MKRKIVSTLLAGIMAMAWITGCGAKDKSDVNLIEANESIEVTPTVTPEATPTQEAEKTEAAISKTEAEQLIVGQYGMEDPGTGNTNSFAYENTITIDGVKYYNFRWSWLVEDHMSYVTNLAVALDGSGIYEVTQDENGNTKLVK